MENHPVPILIVSALMNYYQNSEVFDVVKAGALGFLKLPSGIGAADHETTATDFISQVKLLSQVKVVKRWRTTKWKKVYDDTDKPVVGKTSPYKLVAIGASTGGPPTLQTILKALPKDFPVPILIVQHMSPGFMVDFAAWLTANTSLPVRIAQHLEIATPGTVYCAPDLFNLSVKAGLQLFLEPEDGAKLALQSVTHLFNSVASQYGSNAVAVVLTGMGRDGCDGMKNLHGQGAVTIAQDKQSSVIYGMPKEAIEAGAARYVLNPEQIAIKLKTLFNVEG